MTMSAPQAKHGLETISAEPEDYRFTFEAHPTRVTYGNIGTRECLEFTVIGDSANYAARLESLCKTLARRTPASAEFAQHFPGRFESLGNHAMRGTRGAREIFALKL